MKIRVGCPFHAMLAENQAMDVARRCTADHLVGNDACRDRGGRSGPARPAGVRGTACRESSWCRAIVRRGRTAAAAARDRCKRSRRRPAATIRYYLVPVTKDGGESAPSSCQLRPALRPYRTRLPSAAYCGRPMNSGALAAERLLDSSQSMARGARRGDCPYGLLDSAGTQPTYSCGRRTHVTPPSQPCATRTVPARRGWRRPNSCGRSRPVDDLPLFRELMHDANAPHPLHGDPLHHGHRVLHEAEQAMPARVGCRLCSIRTREARDLARMYVGCFAEHSTGVLAYAPHTREERRSGRAIIDCRRPEQVRLGFGDGGAGTPRYVERRRFLGASSRGPLALAHDARRAARGAVLMRNFTESGAESLEEGTVRLEATFYCLRNVARQSPNEVAPGLLGLLQDPSSEIRQRSAALLGAMAEDSPQVKKYLRGLADRGEVAQATRRSRRSRADVGRLCDRALLSSGRHATRDAGATPREDGLKGAISYDRYTTAPALAGTGVLGGHRHRGRRVRRPRRAARRPRGPRRPAVRPFRARALRPAIPGTAARSRPFRRWRRPGQQQFAGLGRLEGRFDGLDGPADLVDLPTRLPAASPCGTGR